MDHNPGYYLNPDDFVNSRARPKWGGAASPLLVLLISLAISIASPSTLSADDKKEKPTPPPASDSSKSKPDSSPNSPLQQIISEPEKYQGEPGSFHFRDADIRDVLIFFSKIYKLNIIIDPGVSGKVTLRLNNVPWDQALDLILKQNGLALTIEEGKTIIPRKAGDK